MQIIGIAFAAMTVGLFLALGFLIKAGMLPYLLVVLAGGAH